MYEFRLGYNLSLFLRFELIIWRQSPTRQQAITWVNDDKFTDANMRQLTSMTWQNCMPRVLTETLPQLLYTEYQILKYHVLQVTQSITDMVEWS